MALDERARPRAIVGLSAALMSFSWPRRDPCFRRSRGCCSSIPFAPHAFARLARTPGETARFLVRSTGSRIDAQGIACYERLFATPGHCSGAITMMADWDLPALGRDLPRLAIPLLLIHGEADAAIALASARTAAATVANGRLVPLPGLGHLAHEEQPQTVATLITEFVAEVV
jgi:magnesium chelatase accessory protein